MKDFVADPVAVFTPFGSSTHVAAEAANLVRTQILQQAAASVLAQANQAPQLALSLLR